MFFQSFASGSDGNCYYIGNYYEGILIDAGIGVRSIRRDLRTLGLDIHNIRGVFVTHDHTDHVRAISVLSNKHHLPIYATERTHAGIDRNHKIEPKIDVTCRRYITVGETTELCGMCIEPFSVSHDSADCVGYTISGEGWTLTLATDVGCTSEVLARSIERSNVVVMEANYDAMMLEQGPYPIYLKERICSGVGHLANDICGRFLSEHYHANLKHIRLCHLSQINNKPETALETVSHHLTAAGIRVGQDVDVAPLNRLTPSPIIQLQPEIRPTLNFDSPCD